jgi:hypothetical protein
MSQRSHTPSGVLLLSGEPPSPNRADQRVKSTLSVTGNVARVALVIINLVRLEHHPHKRVHRIRLAGLKAGKVDGGIVIHSD